MQEYKLITCIVLGKIASETLEKLKSEKDIVTANKIKARGTSSKTSYKMSEVEILTVVVEKERVDEIFEYLFYLLEIDQPSKGMMLQQALSKMTSYKLPKI
ncbi:MAG: hypothetical protein QG567_1534 [Campylobacterota bacterium]|nr:hypothetical protein [Campylobacterota bacterium]